MKNVFVKVENLKKYFPVNKGIIGTKREYVKAVDNMSFDVNEGAVLGLVGESG